MKSYVILTTRSILDDLTEAELERVISEQDLFLYQDHFAVHVLESKYTDDRYLVTEDLKDAIEHLAVKDGIDVVRFSDDTLGIIGYYNGTRTALEYKRITKDQYDYYKWEEEEEIQELFN